VGKRRLGGKGLLKGRKGLSLTGRFGEIVLKKKRNHPSRERGKLFALRRAPGGGKLRLWKKNRGNVFLAPIEEKYQCSLKGEGFCD